MYNISNVPKSKNEMKGLLKIFLTDFHSGSHVEKIQKINSLIDLGSVDVIVQLVELDSDFRNFCASPTFNEKWISLWSTYGVIITKDIKKALYDQPTMCNKFELFLGIYYYNEALDTASKFKKDYSSSEISYLQKAIRCNSIHACQRYHTYIYSQVDDNKYEYSNELFCKIIRQIKPLLPIYGHYAYIMLAEAYVRCGIFLGNCGRNDAANNSFSAALLALQEVQKLFKPDSVSIYNASFGRTLAESNSLGLSELEDILTFIHTLKNGDIGQDLLNIANEAPSRPTSN